MPEREEFSFSFENGYYPSTALVKGVQDCLIGGQNLLLRGRGLFTSAKGFAASSLNVGAINPIYNVSSGYGGLTGGGNVVQAYANGVYFAAGSGFVIVNGTTLGGGIAGGTINIWTGSALVQAGIAVPGAPVIDDSGATGLNNGAYSIVVTAIRSTTGGESSASLPSNAKAVANHGIKITSLPSWPSAADKVGIYVTKRGFGAIGPYFHLYDVLKSTVDAAIGSGGYVITVPGSVTAGWIDTQLGDLAPYDYSLPPACGFVFAINSVIVAAGAYGGAALSPSYPNKPESYPVKYTLFIPGGGTVTMVKGSGIEGAVLVGTASSLNLVSASQSTISPLNIEPIWPNTGVKSANQICTVGGEIYAWVGGRGPIRDGLGSRTDPGAESTAFAEPVMKAFASNSFGADVKVIYDPANDTVWYIQAAVAIGYVRHLGQWHTPQILPATIVTCLTDVLNNRALLIDASGNAYVFESGSGTVAWSGLSQFQGHQKGSALFNMTIVGLVGHASATVRADIYSNMNVVTPNSQGTNFSVTANHGDFHSPNIQRVRSIALQFSGTTAGGVEIYGADGLKITHPVRI